MIDLILILVILGAAYGGFLLGARYKTLRSMIEEITAKK